MKQLVFVFLLFPIFLFAQREGTDSTYVVKVGNVFYTVTETKFSDGGPSNIMSTVMGDTAAIVNMYVNKFTQEANTYSSISLYLMKRKGVIKEMDRMDASIVSLFGASKSPLLAIQNQHQGMFYANNAGVTGWKLEDSQGSRNITFDLNTNGLLRYRIA